MAGEIQPLLPGPSPGIVPHAYVLDGTNDRLQRWLCNQGLDFTVYACIQEEHIHHGVINYSYGMFMTPLDSCHQEYISPWGLCTLDAILENRLSRYQTDVLTYRTICRTWSGQQIPPSNTDFTLRCSREPSKPAYVKVEAINSDIHDGCQLLNDGHSQVDWVGEGCAENETDCFLLLSSETVDVSEKEVGRRANLVVSSLVVLLIALIAWYHTTPTGSDNFLCGSKKSRTISMMENESLVHIQQNRVLVHKITEVM